MPNETDNEEGAAVTSRAAIFSSGLELRARWLQCRRARSRRPPRHLQWQPRSAQTIAFASQDVLRSYVWANDSGSVERVVAAFTPDGIVQPATGRAYSRAALGERDLRPARAARPSALGAAHHFRAHRDGVTVRSYWKVVQGLASRNTRTLNAMGFYDDFCVKFDGRWLIKEKRIYRCDDETPLPW